MGNAFRDQGNLVEAISCYKKALEIQPEFAEPYGELFHQLQRTCTWQKLQAMTVKLDNLTKKPWIVEKKPLNRLLLAFPDTLICLAILLLQGHGVEILPGQCRT